MFSSSSGRCLMSETGNQYDCSLRSLWKFISYSDDCDIWLLESSCAGHRVLNGSYSSFYDLCCDAKVP